MSADTSVLATKADTTVLSTKQGLFLYSVYKISYTLLSYNFHMSSNYTNVLNKPVIDCAGFFKLKLQFWKNIYTEVQFLCGPPVASKSAEPINILIHYTARSVRCPQALLANKTAYSPTSQNWRF